MMRYSVSTPILPRANRGFTLIELMVVIAIIGILAAIAYPSYQDSVIRANRNDAKGVVMGAAQALERYALQNNTYVGATLGASGVYTDKSPIDGSQRVYTLSLGNLGTSTYTITATPEAGGPNADDGTLTLTETGQKQWIKGSVTKSWNDN